MRLGSIQRDVIAYLTRCGEEGGYIGPTTRAPEFAGYSLEQVELAVDRLLARRVICRSGIRLVMSEKRQ